MNVSGERCNFKAHHPRKRTNPTLMQQLDKSFGFSMNVSGERCIFKAYRPRKRTNLTLMQHLGKTNNSWLYRQKLRVLRERVRRALQLQSTSSEKANQPNTDATVRLNKQ
ncbi:hypothetical protein J6590_049091 [Homalodisca vitripennis]|nr:hypothetical protein J6590_049091 [Homalodisca vitripennis]